MFQKALKVIEEREKSKALYSEMKSRIRKYSSQITTKDPENDDLLSSGIYTDTMDRIIKYINENYTLEIGLQEIASKFFMSVRFDPSVGFYLGSRQGQPSHFSKKRQQVSHVVYWSHDLVR